MRFVVTNVFLLGAAALAFCPSLSAEPPPVLGQAIEKWVAGHGDLALTQQTRVFHDDGKLKTERLERYDPSLPDSQRWRLIEVDGKAPTEDQRRKFETKKNSKPRKKALKPLREYLDLENAKVVSETADVAIFEVSLKSELSLLVAVEKISAIITVEKQSSSITHITAELKDPIRIALGLAKVTGLELDVNIEPARDDDSGKAGEVQDGSTARVIMSRFGDPMEFRWSDFKRVQPYNATAVSQR